jgi:hypothetical protein
MKTHFFVFFSSTHNQTMKLKTYAEKSISKVIFPSNFFHSSISWASAGPQICMPACEIPLHSISARGVHVLLPPNSKIPIPAFQTQF